MKRKFIAAVARALNSVVLRRMWDRSQLGSGTIFAPKLSSNPRLIRGRGSRFDKEAEVGGYVTVVLNSKSVLTGEIEKIQGPDELLLKNGFREDKDENSKLSLANALKNIKYSLAPRNASSSSLGEVFQRFRGGGAICMFPEGTSHDQPDLLPLKCRYFLRLILFNRHR